MTRDEFEALRELPNKVIEVDISYAVRRGPGIEVEFRKVPIVVPGRPDVVAQLDGSYHHVIGKTKFNIMLQGVGLICRVDVNGQNHGDVGRTHKHSIVEPEDPDENLPFAEARSDLDGLTPRQIFDDLCRRANILMRGVYHDP